MDINLDRISEEPSTADAIDTARDRFDVLGYGSSRIVIENPYDDSMVLKLPVGHQGYKQNQNEVEIYNLTEGEDVHSRLHRITRYDSDLRWIEFPKINICFEGAIMQKFSGPSVDHIYDMLEKNGIIMHELETALFDGEPVAYDYGSVRMIKPVD